MCVTASVLSLIEYEVKAVNPPVVQTLNVATFMRNRREISKEIVWQEGKFKFDIPMRVQKEPERVEKMWP